jgi:hypothetical protein
MRFHCILKLNEEDAYSDGESDHPVFYHLFEILKTASIFDQCLESFILLLATVLEAGIAKKAI